LGWSYILDTADMYGWVTTRSYKAIQDRRDQVILNKFGNVRAVTAVWRNGKPDYVRPLAKPASNVWD